MIDNPPEPSPTPEQMIEQRLMQCGLDPSGISVKYEDYLQSIEIVIRSSAGATSEQFGCIREAIGTKIITFEDSQMFGAYTDFVSELTRPQRLAELEMRLTEKGLLEGLPERQDFRSLETFAAALERYSGLAPGSTLKIIGDKISYQPENADDNPIDLAERHSDLLTVLFYVSVKENIGFGFIGNEKVRE